MGWKIPEIKIRVPKVRAPKVPAGRAMPKPRAARGAASGKIDGFSLTVFSSKRCPKGIKDIDVIRALIQAGGNRTKAAEKLGIHQSNISRCSKNIRQLSDARLQKYADKLNITVDDIKRVCADFDNRKGITHIDIIRELIACGGSRTIAAKNMKISRSAIGHHAKNIRQLPDAQLRKYANRLNTTVDEIRRVCADFDPAKGITHIDVIRELLACGGSRTAAAQNLKIEVVSVCRYAKEIRQLDDTQLQKYAVELETTVPEIRRVCAYISSKKGLTRIEIIRALLAADGSRTIAARELGIQHNVISQHAKNIIRLPVERLQEYADTLSKKLRKKISVNDIHSVLAPRIRQKSNFELRVQILQALVASDGSRTVAAQNLKIKPSSVSWQAKQIRQSSEAVLQKYADKLNITVDDIERVCADFDSTKGVTQIEVIRELLACGGSRTIAAQNLGITDGGVCAHIRNIRHLSGVQLQDYATQLNTTAKEIKCVCADFGSQKGLSYVEVISELLSCGGSRKIAAQKLGVTNSNVGKHAQNILRLPEADLAQYAAELGVSVERIKGVCVPRLKQTKEKIFKK